MQKKLFFYLIPIILSSAIFQYAVNAQVQTNLLLEIKTNPILTESVRNGQGRMHSLNTMKNISSIRLYEYDDDLSSREEYKLETLL